MYRSLNKDLATHNQELRDALRRYRYEIIYLNRKLFSQREEFNRWKELIAKTIEQKYFETIDLINPVQISGSRSCDNLKVDSVKHGSPSNSSRAGSFLCAAASVKNRSRSPRSGSPLCDVATDGLTFKIPSGLVAEENSCLIESSPKFPNKFSSRSKSKHPPKIVVEEFKTPPKCPQTILNQSESRRKEDLQTETSCIGDLSSSETETGGTLKNSNISLATINEEKSCSSNAPNETLSDATINCLLDAPCSTPYNQQKLPNRTIFREKKVRVLIKKLSDAKLAHLSIQNSNCSELTKTPLETTLFKSKSVKTEACHSEENNSELGTSHFTRNNSTCKNNINTSEIESFVDPKTIPTKEKATFSEFKSIKMPVTNGKSKRKQNKENHDTDSESNCTNEELNVGTRRLRGKNVSLKEPSLRTKLRNTTNIKF